MGIERHDLGNNFICDMILSFIMALNDSVVKT